MSYWLVILVDRVGNHDRQISPFEARLPSAVSAIVLALATLALGRLLFSPSFALLGSLMTAAASGFVSYTHSARPEMLYAALVTLAILFFTWADIAWQSPHRRRHTKWAAWAAWSALGLAMLTKGPQLPLILIVGLTAYYLSTRRHHLILPVLRPFTGVPIFLALGLWWYAAIFFTLPDARAIWDDEIAVRFTTGNNPWTDWIQPYYLYETAALILPWAVVYPLALLAPWWGRLKHTAPTRMLWCLTVTAMLLLSLAAGRRWYYMLPMLGPLALLMAAVVGEVAHELSLSRKRWIWPTLVTLHVLALAGTALGMAIAQDPAVAPPLLGAIALLIAAAAAAALAWRWRHLPSRAMPAAVLTTLVAALFFQLISLNASVWSDDRFDRRRFSSAVAKVVPAAEPLFGLAGEWFVDAYHLKRDIPTCSDLDQVAARLRERGSIWLLVNQKNRVHFAPRFVAHVAASVDLGDPGKDCDQLRLVHLTLPASESHAAQAAPIVKPRS
jgi:4-amino-4-deoxy-L-arabinose transferase-like glycosyltransferase